MKQAHNTHYSTHQEVSMLLPWYANKTLQGKELTCAETHLKVCLTCRIELAGLYKLSTIVSDVDPLAPSIEISYSKLNKRIKNTDGPLVAGRGKTEAPADNRQFSEGFYLKQLLSGRLTLAVAAAYVLVVLLIQPDNFGSTSKQVKVYQTLSSSKNLITKANEIRIVFSKDINQVKIDEILASVQGRIISGPNQQGVFTIRMDDDRIEADDVNERVSLLRKNPDIIFVEPGISSLPPDRAD